MDTLNDLTREEEKRKVSDNQDWSNLCPDLLRPLLESLSPIDFHGAKLVCSNWYSVSKTCVKRSLCPWQISYKGDSSKFFDTKEYDKSYKTKVLGLSSESYIMASSGNCLLLVDSIHDFCILNMLTRKKIKLPPRTHSPFLPRGQWKDFRYITAGYTQKPAVLWINERTGDCFVAWVSRENDLYLHKKGGDDSATKGWHIIELKVGLFDMAYKNNKLYLYTLDHHIKILDFSGCCPEYEVSETPYHRFQFVELPWEYIHKRKIAIRNSGEVLIILSLKEAIQEEKVLFYVFKMNLESGVWERVYSIGDDEMLIFGHGVTIRAPVRDAGDGIKIDSICFVDDDLWPGSGRPSNCGIFDLATSRITWPKRFGAYIDQTQWFVPAST